MPFKLLFKTFNMARASVLWHALVVTAVILLEAHGLGEVSFHFHMTLLQLGMSFTITGLTMFQMKIPNNIGKF